MRAPSGISSAGQPVGVAVPSQRSCALRTIGRIGARNSIGSRIRSPTSVWVAILAHSSSVSGPGLFRRLGEIASLPMSWNAAA